MKKYVRAGILFFKRETVLCIAVILAMVSSCLVLPDKEYIEYIDFRTLAILFCLMTVMAGFQHLGVFVGIAGKLLKHVRTVRSLFLVLMLLCFFSSMFITNDVALITFVPFTFTVFLLIAEQWNQLLIPIIAMETVAANLGSMLTPIGNPQNLYLYGKSGLGLNDFVLLMLPYTLISLGLLILWAIVPKSRRQSLQLSKDTLTQKDLDLREPKVIMQMLIYLILFGLCLLTVARIIPYGITLAMVVITVTLADKKLLGKVDYGLLITFMGFFVFIGNMGRIPVFSRFLSSMIQDREVITSVISSQVISNVPAALLLSGFTENYEALIVGTNLGGLGTLIASMASLISFKYMGKEAGNQKGRYLSYFTIMNVIFLAVLMCYYIVSVT